MMQRASLNAFQRLTRRWDAVHPYNAAQVMMLTIAPTSAEIDRAWRTAMQRLRLGKTQVDGKRYGFVEAELEGVREIPASVCLAEYLTNELNLRFGKGEVPFRPFLQREEGGCSIGVVYAHWVADSVAIRMLLRAWLREIVSPGNAATMPVRLADRGYWKLFGPGARGWMLAEGVISAYRWFHRMRRVRRLRGGTEIGTAERVTWRAVERGWIDALALVARQRGVTVNDLFVAAGAIACGEHLPYRKINRRSDIGIGMIIDLRQGSTDALSNVFGLFLGFANVIARPADLRDSERLLRHVTAQTRLIKKNRSAAMSMIWIWSSLICARFMSPTSAYNYYRKHMPLSAGVSNVNLTPTWVINEFPGIVRRFIRVSPTGPTIPLTITPTTLGDDFHVAFTWREGLIDRQTMEQIIDRFLGALEAYRVVGA